MVTEVERNHPAYISMTIELKQPSCLEWGHHKLIGFEHMIAVKVNEVSGIRVEQSRHKTEYIELVLKLLRLEFLGT